MKLFFVVIIFTVHAGSLYGMVADNRTPQEKAKASIDAIVKTGKEVPERDLLERNTKYEITEKPLLGNLNIMPDSFFKTKDAQKLLFLLLQVTYPYTRLTAIECINKLLDKGATFDPSLKTYENNNLLHYACWQDNLRAVKAILSQSNGKDLINQPNSFGNRPLNVAVDQSREACVEELLNAGASVTAINQNKETPLYDAKKAVIASQLIAKGADVNAKDRYNATPLHRAASYNRLEVAKVLLENGADVLAQTDMMANSDNAGATPLHAAAGAGHVEMVKLLLAYGAGLEIKNKQEKTPLGVAINALRYPQDKSEKVVECLIQLGATIDKPAMIAAAGQSFYIDNGLKKLGILDKASSEVADSGIQKIYDAGQSVREEVEQIKKSRKTPGDKTETQATPKPEPLKGSKDSLVSKLTALKQKIVGLKNNLELLKNRLVGLKKKL